MTTASVSDVLIVSREIRIPRAEFTFTFSRSGGPGGQNVNKVNTKARLEWAVAESAALPDDVKARFLAANRRRVTAEGRFQISSQRFRDQSRNVDDCLAKLRELVTQAATVSKPRKKTRPGRASQERRLAEKRRQASRKQQRRPPVGDE